MSVDKQNSIFQELKHSPSHSLANPSLLTRDLVQVPYYTDSLFCPETSETLHFADTCSYHESIS